MQISVNSDIEIKSLADLPKLKLLMESLKMIINKSKLARDMGVDRRTIVKYFSPCFKASICCQNSTLLFISHID